MKKSLLVIIAFFISVTVVTAQKDTCNVGVYISNIYDYRLDEKSFMADFWMWINYKNDSLQFENVTEMTNSKTAEFSMYRHEKMVDWNWVTQKCKAQIMYDWDVAKFPFDKQHLRIEIEDSEYDTSQVIYQVDKANSKIASGINTKEWNIIDFSVHDEIKTYETTYGNPSLSGQSSYSRIVAEITIKRNNSWLMLAKMMTGAYVAFLIACFVFFISPDNPDSRFGLCVGGLFAAIGNKYIVESVVPTSTTNTLMDNAHNLTFSFILLIVIFTILSIYLFESESPGKKRLAKLVDRYSFYSIFFLYVIINSCMIYSATT